MSDDWTLVVNPTPAEEVRGPEKIQRRFKITLDEMRDVERVSKVELSKCLELLKEKDGLKKINETIHARRLLMTPFDWEQLVRADRQRRDSRGKWSRRRCSRSRK